VNRFHTLFVRLLMVLVLTLGVSVFAANAQKGESTPEPSGEGETEILTLPLLFSGEAVDLSFEGTNGALLAAFNASEGDVVDISMTATTDSLDPYIVVFDWNAQPVAQNDDSDAGLDSFIEDLEIPADGTYFVLATTFSAATSEDTGDADQTFQLLVEGNTQPADIEEDSFSYTVYTAELGEPYDVDINADTLAYFVEFTGEAGQTVTIDAPSESLDTFMMLFDINGNRIAVDDDSGDQPLSAHIEVELPDSGSYLLILTTYNYEDFAAGEGEVNEGVINFIAQ
jgi:hypothetical protein